VSFDEVGWGSGHVFRVERRQGPVWYAKYRLPDGRQVKRRIGPGWTGRGRPAAGYVTKRGAEQWLRTVLDEARERARSGALGLDATFAEAAAEWLRYVEHDRACKPSTMRAYRSSVSSRLLPVFGAMKLHDITPAQIERWRSALPVSPRTKNKLLVELHGIFRRAQKVYGLQRNPAADVEPLRVRSQIDVEVFSPEEVRRSPAPRTPSRMRRCSSRPRSRDCGAASCSRCAGATSTSPGQPFGCGPRSPPAP